MAKILIIEDNEQDRKIAKRFLLKAGYTDISIAETGEEGVKKVELEKPELVITDTKLPGIDGFEVCKQIKEAKLTHNPKVIIVTGSIDAVDAVKARKLGADDYCAKTSDFSPLLEAIKHIL
jgi:DNA-binding response OmpR family regulator